ncbi:MAG TPA: cytochrome C [Alphaproteobacteria bacterium]|nr:cytochrome C [Alphaproteobacteria bacterium]
MAEPRIRVFLDDQPEPVADYRPPAEVTLDTKNLPDGEHRLRIEAQDATGQIGVRRVQFLVRNGPGITISGLNDGAVVHGLVRFMVNAFGAEEPFEPHRAESRSPIPVWVWVLTLVVVAWSAWYFATLWSVPPDYAKMPTYAAPMNPFS